MTAGAAAAEDQNASGREWIPRIQPLPHTLDAAIQERLDQKTKPRQSLGVLEAVAAQVARLQQSLQPALRKPTVLIAAADHGVARRGVSAYPPEVTAQMVQNFLSGGAAINCLARQFDLSLCIANVGVDCDPARFDGAPWRAELRFLNQPVRRGAGDIVVEDAMSEADLRRLFAVAGEYVASIVDDGCQLLAVGEMGIGNSTAASALYHQLLKLPVQSIVGRGTGVDLAGLERKRAALEAANERVGGVGALDALQALRRLGGLEIAFLTAVILHAAAHDRLVLVDGFIAGAAALCAIELEAEARERLIFSHESRETGHAAVLAAMGVRPLLRLELALGEGSGAALAIPLLQAAVTLFNDMASFESAGVSEGRRSS